METMEGESLWGARNGCSVPEHPVMQTYGKKGDELAYGNFGG